VGLDGTGAGAGPGQRPRVWTGAAGRLRRNRPIADLITKLIPIPRVPGPSGERRCALPNGMEIRFEQQLPAERPARNRTRINNRLCYPGRLFSAEVDVPSQRSLGPASLARARMHTQRLRG
jgi:hypothetical protein